MSANKNVLLEEWRTPFGIPPFDRIQITDYLPAFDAALQRHNNEIDAIVQNPEAPTFENTVEALEFSGAQLERIGRAFYAIASAHTTDEVRAIESTVTPRLAAHSSAIFTRADLFRKIQAVHDVLPLGLSAEQRKLLQEHYSSFVRSGANLPETERKEIVWLDEELSRLEKIGRAHV